MGIPAWPGFVAHNPMTGAVIGATADRQIAHLKCYTTFLPGEVVGSAVAKTFTANDLNTLWAYQASDDVTWTLPADLNPPLVWGSGVGESAEGILPLIIKQYGAGKVTLVVGVGLTVVKAGDLAELRTNGIGTGLQVFYWPSSRGLVEIAAI